MAFGDSPVIVETCLGASRDGGICDAETHQGASVQNDNNYERKHFTRSRKFRVTTQ